MVLNGTAATLLLLVSSVFVANPAKATHQTQNVVPKGAYSHSWYVTKNDGNAIRLRGELDGKWDTDHSSCDDNVNDNSDKVVVLDFGRPIRVATDGPYYGYAQTMFGGAGNVRLDTVVWLVEQYAAGWYAASSGCPKLTLALGTSNSYLCSGGVQPCDPHEFGMAFSDAVREIQNWLTAQGYGWQITPIGASDMETYGGNGWACAGPTRAFVDGFGGRGAWQLWNFGEAITSPNCWSIQDVHYVSWGHPVAYPLPEIYNSNFVCHWTDANCSDGFSVEKTVGPVVFRGAMTECQNADPIPYSNCTVEGRTEYGPSQAWDKLWQRGNTFGAQSSLWYVTNIKFQP
jgi:hypothetical protein